MFAKRKFLPLLSNRGSQVNHEPSQVLQARPKIYFNFSSKFPNITGRRIFWNRTCLDKWWSGRWRKRERWGWQRYMLQRFLRILPPIVPLSLSLSLSDHRSHTVIGDPLSSGEYGLWDGAWGRSGLLSNVLADHHLTQNRQARNIFQFVSSSKCSGPLTQNMQARILKKKRKR